MKEALLTAFLSLLFAFFISTDSMAKTDVFFSFGVGFPAPVFVAPAPVFVVPPTVITLPPPVIVQPAPIFPCPPGWYHGNPYGWHRGKHKGWYKHEIEFED
ncbi:MAG: hypothetical protein KatS3mg078_2029 [Deltaproteobacteria bacterium]|jgi:hypothetical protein|nr:MAG: hypothetical protein KatS3mg078_2029 [Deltaproteobacteria bacterium]